MPITEISGDDSLAASRAIINANFAYLASLTGAVVSEGVTEALSVGASPYTYTAGTGFEFVYISGGSVISVTRHGVNITVALPIMVALPPGDSVVVTYDEAPTMVVSK